MARAMHTGLRTPGLGWPTGLPPGCMRTIEETGVFTLNKSFIPFNLFLGLQKVQK